VTGEPPVDTFADGDLLDDLPDGERQRVARLIATAEYAAGHTFYARGACASTSSRPRVAR
jgi:hypothetical protein